MAKIADYKYPRELDPEEAEEWVDVLVNDFGGTAESDESFAQAVGHRSATSGTFRRKIADARKYGLMAPRGTFKATDLGFKLANPEDDRSRHEAYYEMLQNIELLTDIHDAISGNIPDEFWRVLTEQTDANPRDAREAADDIENLYETLVDAERKLEQSEVEEEKREEPSDVDGPDEVATATPDSALYVKVGNDELRFDALNDTNLRLVRQFLGSKMEEPPEDDLKQARLGG